MSDLFTLYVYIDPRLLVDKSDLANFCFARKVNDKYNVVFQGTKSTLLTASNMFQWEEDYAMGATMHLHDGAHVSPHVIMLD